MCSRLILLKKFKKLVKTKLNLSIKNNVNFADIQGKYKKILNLAWKLNFCRYLKLLKEEYYSRLE